MAEQIVAPPSEAEQAAMTVTAEIKGESLIVRAIDGLWRLLRRPWLLVTLLAVLGATLLWARTLPQIPGQLTESAAEATRWLNGTLSSSSIAGAELARSLGLFDLYSSPWLRVLLALVTLLAAVQLADAIGTLRAWRAASYRASLGESGEPAPLAQGAMARIRIAVDAPVERVDEMVREWAATARMETVNLDNERAEIVNGAVEVQDEGQNPHETRLLMRRRGWSAWLAPLLALGALIGALLLWANLFWAWNLRPDVIAPGVTFENARRGFAVTNHLIDVNGRDTVTLLTVGSTETLPVDGLWHRLDLPGWTRARANAETAAMVIGADEALLALPNAPKPQERVGLLLPATGSEQFVVLPQQGIGIRVVRLTDGNAERYYAEVYGEDSVQPLVREEILGAQTLDVPLAEGESLTLEIAPASGLHVEVERGYGRWLWLPALLLILAGFVALVLPARVVLAQLSRWERERTLLIAQGTAHKDVAALLASVWPQSTS